MNSRWRQSSTKISYVIEVMPSELARLPTELLTDAREIMKTTSCCVIFLNPKRDAARRSTPPTDEQILSVLSRGTGRTANYVRKELRRGHDIVRDKLREMADEKLIRRLRIGVGVFYYKK